jgi:FKBP-type peptidyl-prolyl cis-trans isomerase 2
MMPQGASESCVVGPEVWVHAHYRLFDAESRLVEDSRDEEPIVFLFGQGQIGGRIEAALEARRAGDTVRVALTADEAFGPRDPEALLWVDRDELPDVAVGDELEAEREDGQTVFLRVLELQPEAALLDSNHPLAGQDIELEFTIERAERATSEEVAAAQAELASRAAAVGAATNGGSESQLLPVAQLLRRN